MRRPMPRCPIEVAVIFEQAAYLVAYPRGKEAAENPAIADDFYQRLIASNSSAMEKTGDETMIAGAQFLRCAML